MSGASPWNLGAEEARAAERKAFSAIHYVPRDYRVDGFLSASPLASALGYSRLANAKWAAAVVDMLSWVAM